MIWVRWCTSLFALQTCSHIFGINKLLGNYFLAAQHCLHTEPWPQWLGLNQGKVRKVKLSLNILSQTAGTWKYPLKTLLARGKSQEQTHRLTDILPLQNTSALEKKKCFCLECGEVWRAKSSSINTKSFAKAESQDTLILVFKSCSSRDF